MLEPFKSGQAEIGVKAPTLFPFLPKGRFGESGFDDCRAKRRSPSELAVLKIADCIGGSAIQRDRNYVPLKPHYKSQRTGRTQPSLGGDRILEATASAALLSRKL